MNRCKIQGKGTVYCDRFQEWIYSHPTASIRIFEYCPCCRERIKPLDNNDPWLYDNALIEIIHRPGERELQYYTGQDLTGKEYCVRGTPWENVPHDVEEIKINSIKNVFYKRLNKDHGFVWNTCPRSLLAENGKANTYKRPEWTKHLKGKS